MRRTVQFLIPEHSSPLSHQKEQWSRWVEGAVVNQSMITPQSSICARVQGCGSSSQSRIDEPSENWFQKTPESDYETVKTKSGTSSGVFETRWYEIEKKTYIVFLRSPPSVVVGLGEIVDRTLYRSVVELLSSNSRNRTYSGGVADGVTPS